MPTYCTVDDVKFEMKANEAASLASTESAKLLTLCRRASEKVDRLFQSRRPFFFPYIESRQKPVNDFVVNSGLNTLALNDNLLALNTVTAGTTGLTVGSTVEAWPTLESPYRYLRLMSFATYWYQYLPPDGTPMFVTVNGTWGFHRDYANAWITDDVASAIASTTVTTFTVADVDGADSYGRIPRISAGNLIKIDSELMEVTATNTGTNTVTVRRGVHGSTAATHSVSAPVYVWQVEETIRQEVARQVGYVYARRAAFDNYSVMELGVQQFPPTMVASLVGAVEGFAYGLP